MPRFSKISKERLETCHPDIQAVCNELIKQYDFSVLCGHRGEKEQNQAYRKGTSQVKYPNSAHNKKPSMAVDLAPYKSTIPHIDWEDISAFKELVIRFDTVAKVLKEQGKIKSDFVFGADYKTWKDYPHFAIKEN